MSGNGGKRAGSGRKPGAAARKTREAADLFAAVGITPLDYFRGLLTGTAEYDEVKFEAAKAAAPFVHPRLAAIEHSGKVAIPTVALLPEVARDATDWAARYAPKDDKRLQ